MTADTNIFVAFHQLEMQFYFQNDAKENIYAFEASNILIQATPTKRWKCLSDNNAVIVTHCTSKVLVHSGYWTMTFSICKISFCLIDGSRLQTGEPRTLFCAGCAFIAKWFNVHGKYVICSTYLKSDWTFWHECWNHRDVNGLCPTKHQTSMDVSFHYRKGQPIVTLI